MSVGQRFRAYLEDEAEALAGVDSDLLQDSAFCMAHGFAMGLRVAKSHPEYAMALLAQLGHPWNANDPSTDSMPLLVMLDVSGQPRPSVSG